MTSNKQQATDFGDLFQFDAEKMIKRNDKLNHKGQKLSIDDKRLIKTETRDLNCRKMLDEFDGFPKPGEILAVKTNGQTDAGSYFNCAIDEFGSIDEMYLATWTISKGNINRLKAAIENGTLKKLVMIISSTLKPANPALYASLAMNLIPFENVTLKEVNSHAKTFSIKCGNNYLTVSGSANWSENPRIENYLILNSLPLFEHHKEWMNEL